MPHVLIYFLIVANVVDTVILVAILGVVVFIAGRVAIVVYGIQGIDVKLWWASLMQFRSSEQVNVKKDGII